MSPAYYNKMMRQADRINGTDHVKIYPTDGDTEAIKAILFKNFGFRYETTEGFFEVYPNGEQSLSELAGQLWYRLNGFRFVMKHNKQ